MVRLGNTSVLTMYYGASTKSIDRASQLRKRLTFPERMLWQELKNKQLLGLHFRRQHPIGHFIADFYCHKIMLVIELDGSSHHGKEAISYDQNRTVEMEKFGITVIRFNNEEVIHQIQEVLNKIAAVCEELIAKD